MYYRRKVLLALLEVFGGNLGNTDCEKLLFSFCQMTGKNHYDFFPYHYGPFSFLSYYDKRRLTELGLLKAVDDFQLAEQSISYLEELEPADQRELFQLKKSGLRGQPLIRKVYRDFPQYAARSKIIAGLFNDDEIKQIKFSWDVDFSSVLFSMGYEGLTIDSFINKLITRNIMMVVDVRNNPQSMKYGFSKRSFQEYIQKAGIRYIHIPELGIPSSLRKGLGTSVSHTTLFSQYETEILPKQLEARKQLLDLIAQIPRIALVCFEADYRCCHRNTLIENLKKETPFEKPVFHI